MEYEMYVGWSEIMPNLVIYVNVWNYLFKHFFSPDDRYLEKVYSHYRGERLILLTAFSQPLSKLEMNMNSRLAQQNKDKHFVT